MEGVAGENAKMFAGVFYDFFLFVFQVLEENLSSVQRSSVTTPTPRTAQNTMYAFSGVRSWNLAQEGLCTGQFVMEFV